MNPDQSPGRPPGLWSGAAHTINRTDALPFVIPTGGVMGLWPTQGDEKRLGPATTFYATVALSFVISTEAYPDFLPRCTGQGRVCAFL
jgi:hypothetical protein